MWQYNYSDELYHHGIKGQKWGVRRYQNEDGSLTAAGKKRQSYTSTSISAAAARRANAKVDKGFNKWKADAAKQSNAIELGKKATAAKLAYESDRGNKDLKRSYKDANKEYKKALSKNTAYRQGTVRHDVGQDAARKYLSAAKKVKKSLDSDPSNKALQKQYNELMSKHDIERAKARRASEVGAKRSAAIASAKRSMTIGVKALAGTATVAAGVYAVNRCLNQHGVTIDGKKASISASSVRSVADLAKKAKDALGFIF